MNRLEMLIVFGKFVAALFVTFVAMMFGAVLIAGAEYFWRMLLSR